MNQQPHHRRKISNPEGFASYKPIFAMVFWAAFFSTTSIVILTLFKMDSGFQLPFFVLSLLILPVGLEAYRSGFKNLLFIVFLKSIIVLMAILLVLFPLSYKLLFSLYPNSGFFENFSFAIFLWFLSIFIYKKSGFHPSSLTATPNNPPPIPQNTTPNGLSLGESTGYLKSLSHGSGVPLGQKITLGMEDASQNILVLGGIGSGKTTRVMHSLLFQLLKKGYGGLIFDIKGDFSKATCKLAEEANREDLVVFGPGHEKMNLLSGLSPEIAASFLKSAFILGNGGKQDSFWIDTATELCRNSLGVLSFLPQQYSLEGLYSYLFDGDKREELDAQVREKLPELDERDTRLLRSYLNYHESVFSRFDEKVISGVNATVSQILSPFNHPDLVDAFCTEPQPKDECDPFQMEDILLPFVIFIDLPLSVWGLGAKVVYTFIKLRFFNIMQGRNRKTKYDDEDPVFFMCDEYQEIISANKDGLSDLNFWDKSRSSKTIGIISTQSVSSIYASIINRDLANAILQNFRQKICFRTEDQSTIDMFQRLLGRVEVEKKSSSFGESSPNSLFNPSNPSQQWSQNTTTVEKAVLDPQLIRNLHQGQALALLSINGKSHDDIINTIPKYI